MEFKSDKERASYAYGLYLARTIKGKMDIDPDVLNKGMKDGLAGTAGLKPEEVEATLNEYATAERGRSQAKNKEAGDKWLAENKKKEGVKSFPVEANGKTYELQYKVIKEGTGAMPKLEDEVTTHYRGRLLDGTEFDSSYSRNEPMSFPVSGVIKGWTEALQKMKVGSKWELYIPAELAYGERGAGPIPANSTLIFDVELLKIGAPKNEPPKLPEVKKPEVKKTEPKK